MASSSSDLERTATQLLKAIEEDRLADADALIQKLHAGNQAHPMRAIATLTMELRAATMASQRCLAIARDGIPSANEDLRYVVTSSETATHDTLDAIDAISKSLCAMRHSTEQLGERCRRLAEEHLPSNHPFASDVAAMTETIGVNHSDASKSLGRIVEAQGYQDLTGQVIGRVMQLVEFLADEVDAAIDERYLTRPVKSTTSTRLGPRTGVDSDTAGQAQIDDMLEDYGL